MDIERETESLVEGRVVEVGWDKRPEPILVAERALAPFELGNSRRVSVAALQNRGNFAQRESAISDLVEVVLTHQFSLALEEFAA